jgi:hypothetical protein
MALAEAIESKIKLPRERTCTVPTLFKSLSKDDQKAFLTHLIKGTATSTLTAALRSEGYKLSDEKLNRHRRGLCECPSKK